MSADNLTTQFISDTYRRLLQLSDNGNYVTDGTGSVVNLVHTTSSWALSSSYASAASDILVTVLNNSGVQINKGAVVHISSSNNSSDTPRVALADWTNDSLSANTLGLATTDIAAGAIGQVLTEGLFLGYDTSTPGWVSGQLLYLSSSGTITGSTPHAPLHTVRLGQVVRVQSNNGSIYVKVDNGYEIDELHDVKVTSAAVGDLLIRSSSVWINSKVLTGSYTLSGSLTTNDGVSVQSLTASFVSASSITGSLFGTASWAITASHATTASYLSTLQSELNSITIFNLFIS